MRHTAKIWVFIATVAISGCELPFGKIYDAKQKVRAGMRDPDSPIFRNVRKVDADLEGVVVCGEVKGKNGYGGYGRFIKFHVSGRSQIASFEPDATSFESGSNKATMMASVTFRYNLYKETCGF